MCGRFVSVSTPEQLAEAFGVDDIRTDSHGERYNVAPTVDIYSIIEHQGARRLGTLRWGFLPRWAKTLKDRAPINARLEGIDSGRMFASAVKRHRCLLPADGFYEWQKREDSTRKQPWYIHHPDGTPLVFAGIWSSWRDPQAGDDADPVHSCAIITTAAQGRMVDLHHRMPVILPSRLWEAWLGPDEDVDGLLEVVRNAEVPRLEARTITDRVNNVRNRGPELLEPGTVG